MSEDDMDDRAERLTRELLEHFVDRARYWARLPDFDKATGRHYTIEDRCLGAVFSVLAALDGVSGFPPFDLVVESAPDTPEYADEDHEYDGVVISTTLHDRMPA